MAPTSERGHRVDVLATAIRDAIMAGSISPGQRIDQDDWAERMNLSRTPVRLALERLEAQGFVRLLPRRGAVVVEVTTQHLEDVLAGRLLLEPALGRAGAANLTEHDFRVLREENRQVQAVPLPEGHRELEPPAGRFHSCLYTAAGLPMLHRHATQSVDHSHVFLNRQWYANRKIAQVTKLYYAELLTACEARNLDRVETVMREHRVDLAGVVLRERVSMAQLRVLPSLLRKAELARLARLVDKDEEPQGPSPAKSPPRRKTAR